MNLPNFLTVFRIFLTVVFLFLIFREGAASKAAALAVFAFASYTDYLDGQIARRQKLITPFGQLMDPIADKFLVFGAFVSFVRLDVVPAWIVIVMMAREILVTGIRLVAARRGIVLEAQKGGKLKTVLQLACILSILGCLILRELPDLARYADPGLLAANVMLYVVLASTLHSGFQFLAQNRKALA